MSLHGYEHGIQIAIYLVTSLPPLGITILEYSVKLTRERGKKCQGPYPSMIESKRAHSNFQPQQCQG